MPRVRGFFNAKNFSLMIDQKEVNDELDSYFTLTDSQCWESAALRALIRLKIASPEELEDRIGGLAAEWLQDNDYDTVETRPEGWDYLYNYFTQPYDNLKDLLFDLFVFSCSFDNQITIAKLFEMCCAFYAREGSSLFSLRDPATVQLTHHILFNQSQGRL